jgi:uncharacterized protein (DUF885 family)
LRVGTKVPTPKLVCSVRSYDLTQKYRINKYYIMPKQKNDSDSLLNSLFSEYDEFNLVQFPETATYEGDHRFDDKLTDLSFESVSARDNKFRWFLSELKDIDYNTLSQDNRLNYDLFKMHIERGIEGEKFNWHYMPIEQQSGIHIYFPQIIEIQPATTKEDFEKYFKRLRGFEKQVDDTIANMKRGMESGLVMPSFIMELTLPQIKNIKDVPVEKSVFYSPLEKENKLSPEEKEKISIELKDIISNNIIKAYGKLNDFIKNQYIPGCRSGAGIWELPDGKQRYEFLIKEYTSLELTAEEIYNIGLKEIKRLRAEMEKVKNETGFKGSFDEFNSFIRSDAQFYYTDKNDLINGFRKILGEMDAKLPDLFDVLPQSKYDLKEMEEYRAKSAPAAYYYPAPLDRSRPGYFYVNTFDLSARPKYSMTALALHEAVPGHHLQIALAQEFKNVPKFRRELGQTAFVEGWALYAESLGYETGMYEDLYQKYGALTMEIWRACRLVVDTGLHHKKWTRRQAFEFMKENSPNSEADIWSEIDRYIAWPGQALAYKIGELEIKRLRKKAESQLGNKFNIKKFHNTLLSSGAIHLPLLRKIVDRWIEKELK